MIVPKWGLVRKYHWDPSDQATDILVTAYRAYIMGARLSSDTNYLHEDDGMLKASFGRGNGHTTSVNAFAWENPQIKIMVVSPTYRQYRSFTSRCGAPNVCHQVLSETNQPLSVGLQGRPEIIFYDLDTHAYQTYQQRIRHLVVRNTTRKHVLLLSDAVDMSTLESTTVEVEAGKSILSQLPEAEYGIASDRRKTLE